MREEELIPVEQIVEAINSEDDYRHKITVQRIMRKISHGCPNTGSYSEDVDIRLWLPEMNSVNVTMFCDRLFEKYNAFDGFIFLITANDDINCLSVLNIEDQSSGFEICEKVSIENNNMLIMRANPSKIKNELNIPDDYRKGFEWGNHQPDLPIPSHSVPTSQYNSRYILNFSVCGEFDLDVCYLPNDSENAIWLFGKYFCCK